MPPFFQRTLLFITCSLFLPGCPSGAELENSQNWGPNSNASCDPTPIFETECSGAACHSSPTMMPFGGIDLLAPDLAERLIDQPATYPSLSDPRCDTENPELLVSSLNPARSLLLTKLNGEHDCGSAMPIPRQANYLPPADIACIADYINTIIANRDVEGIGSADGNGGSSNSMTTTPSSDGEKE